MVLTAAGFPEVGDWEGVGEAVADGLGVGVAIGLAGTAPGDAVGLGVSAIGLGEPEGWSGFVQPDPIATRQIVRRE